MIVYATDEWFGSADNLLKRESPVEYVDEYCETGKCMDGWETRRKKQEGHDYCIIKLEQPMIVNAIEIDTSYFVGNYAPHMSLDCTLCPSNTFDELQNVRKHKGRGTETSVREYITCQKLLKRSEWFEMCKTDLKGNTNVSIESNYRRLVSHLKVNIYPDGGIARIKIIGNVNRDVEVPLSINSYSNAHFGAPYNLLKGDEVAGMHDGWETRRHLKRPNEVQKYFYNDYVKNCCNDYVVFKCLKELKSIKRIEIDTHHFKGNCPESVQVDVKEKWSGVYKTILHRVKIKPDSYNTIFPEHNCFVYDIEYIKFLIYPDGGVGRISFY